MVGGSEAVSLAALGRVSPPGGLPGSHHRPVTTCLSAQLSPRPRIPILRVIATSSHRTTEDDIRLLVTSEGHSFRIDLRPSRSRPYGADILPRQHTRLAIQSRSCENDLILTQPSSSLLLWHHGPSEPWSPKTSVVRLSSLRCRRSPTDTLEYSQRFIPTTVLRAKIRPAAVTH